MSMRYKGGVISATPPTIDGWTAPGIWTLEQQMQAQGGGTWPLTQDPYFDYVTMLLQGDGPNGGQNNTFLDSSTNNFTITRNGNTTQGSFNPFGSNWSNYFGGDGNYIYAPYNVFASVAGDFTIETWVNVADAGRSIDANKTGTIVSGYATNNITNSWGFFFTITAGVIAQMTFLTSDVTRMSVTGLSISLNIWHHIALVRSGTTLTLYVDGTSVGTATYGTSFTTNTLATTQIARSAFGGSYQNWTKGYFSNLRMVNGTAVYTGNFTPSTAPLTAITNTALLTCQSSYFKDNSANNYAITSTGAPSVQRFSPFAPTLPYATTTDGGSGYFDGTGDYLSLASNAAFAAGANNFTLEMWIYTLAAPGTSGFLYDNRPASTNGAYLALYMASNRTIRLYVSSADRITSAVLSLNAWYHVAVSRSAGTTTMYINGVSAGTWADSTTYTQSGAYIGASYSGGAAITNYFTGYISNLRFVNGQAVYTGAFTPPTAPLTAVSNTALLLNTTNAAIFDTAEINVLETFGNAQISTSVVKFGTGSLAFDGAGDYTLNRYAPALFDWYRGNYTLEAWIYPTTYTGWYYVDGTANKGTLIGNNAATSATNYWSLGLNSTGKLWFAYYTGTNQGGGSTDTVALNTWTHVAMVKNGTNITLYVNGNGTSLGAVVGTPQSSTTVSLLIGVGNNAYINGYVDGLRITQGIARYTANFTPPTAAFQNY